ncbi:MAG TPA: hypothetical protein VNG32_03955, partial [Candidatus Dormibacteraeota bacterium]|nr:hypothetical protein [Candidatus Dormibacteraeota bacterium]
MDTYSVAPPVDGYNYVNTDPGSPYYMWDYKLGASKPDGSIEHVYGDGRTNWVKVGFVDVPAGQWTPPPGASPNTLETSSVPGAPIINPPAAPAPPPAPAPGPPPSNPAPPPNGGPEIEAIQKEEQTIESEIGRMAGAQLPKEAYQQDSQIQQGIRELQNQI